MEFTEEQINIFQFVKEGNGHGIIDAVAGAGKTTTIMQCARHIGEKSALFCAFNKSIANEIRQKFSDLNISGVTTKTIHSLGFGILRDNNHGVRKYRLEEKKYDQLLKNNLFKKEVLPFYKSIIEINDLEPDELDNENQSFAIRNLIYDANSKIINMNQKARSILLKESIEDFKNMTLHYNIFSTLDSEKERFDEEIKSYYNIHKVLLKYGNNLSKEYKVIDFTDMIYLHYIWNLMPTSKFEFLFIDECQDLSKAQLATAVKHGKKGTRVLSVGDPSQSIYGFTGADIESFNRIKTMTKASELPLTACFRCPKLVIDIAKTIREDINGVKNYDGLVLTITRKQVMELAKPGDLIISRIKAPLMEMVFEFIKKDVRVKIHPDEVRDFISDLRRIFKRDEASADIEIVYGGFEKFKDKVSRRWKWIFQKNSERIKDETARQLYINQEEQNLDNKLNFLNDRYTVWKNKIKTVKEVIDKVKGYITADSNSIRLSSIHRAKGLEEKNVFILDYDSLPFQRPDQKDWEKIQEINLKYVAVTRSEEKLYLIKSPIEEIDELLGEIDDGSLFDEFEF